MPSMTANFISPVTECYKAWVDTTSKIGLFDGRRLSAFNYVPQQDEFLQNRICLICIYNKIETNFGFKIDFNHQCQFETFRRNVEEMSSKTYYNLFLSIEWNLQYSNICHSLSRQTNQREV